MVCYLCQRADVYRCAVCARPTCITFTPRSDTTFEAGVCAHCYVIRFLFLPTLDVIDACAREQRDSVLRAWRNASRRALREVRMP